MVIKVQYKVSTYQCSVQGFISILKCIFRHICYHKNPYIWHHFCHICHFCIAFWLTVFHSLTIYECKGNVLIPVLSIPICKHIVL